MGFLIENGVLKEYTEEPGVTEVVIPDSVTTIGNYAFSGCSNLTSAIIPDSVTTIGEYAFDCCKSLTNIVIPDSVTTISWGAFAGCNSLTSVVIPSSVTIIWSGTFSDCTSLTSIVIPDSVIPIGACAFSGCSSLTSITIPDSVTSIGYFAFSGCSSLTSITIPDSVTFIGEKAFDGCTGLKTIITKTKLALNTLGNTMLKNPIFTNDPAMLPQKMRPLAAIGYAENPEEFEPGRKKAHLKYLKSNAAKLVTEALAHPALLQLILENKLLKPEAADAFLKAANEQQNAEAVAMLLDYQANKLTAKEKEKAAQKAEAREEKVTDFIFNMEALQELQGKVFVVTGKLTTFISRDEFKACLEACGATLSETLNEQTAYLITNTPNSGSAKNKKAESLGVKKLTEAEFNAMINRK